MANEQEKMKNMVENLIINLKKQGINVDEAAVLKLSNTVGKTTQQTQQTVESILKQMNEKGLLPPEALKNVPQGSPVYEQNVEEPVECWCPNCFTFDNFEERLTPLGGNFDYPSVSFLGKIYDFKYFLAKDGREFMMSRAKQFAIDPNWTAPQLQDLLNLAVQGKEFDKAQLLLTALNNAKN